MGHLGLGRQLARHLLLGAAQDEGFESPAQVRQALLVGLLLDRGAVVAGEARCVAEPAGHEEVEQRPEFAQVVFQRRAGQAQALPGLQLAGGQRGLAARILDVLRFVENQQLIGLRRQRLEVARQQGVGGQDDVVLADQLEQRTPLRPVQGQHPELRGEVRGFVLPVGDQAGGHDDQRRAVQAPGLFLAEDMRQGLQGLAQAHVVGQHAADFQLGQRLHPGQAMQLIGPQGGLQAGRRLDLLRAVRLQALGKAAQLLAALPVQRRALLQFAQACGVGARQAQALAGLARLAEEQLAQGRQQGLEAGEGQGDVLVALRQADQQHLLVLALGQGIAVEQPGLVPDRLQQDRQQADALPFDLDAQFQIEPVVLGRLFDRGVPVVDLRQVVAELRLQFDPPALLA
ncbi:hypothetical protein D3C84_366940 [compost metagenome]